MCRRAARKDTCGTVQSRPAGGSRQRPCWCSARAGRRKWHTHSACPSARVRSRDATWQRPHQLSISAHRGSCRWQGSPAGTGPAASVLHTWCAKYMSLCTDVANCIHLSPTICMQSPQPTQPYAGGPPVPSASRPPASGAAVTGPAPNGLAASGFGRGVGAAARPAAGPRPAPTPAQRPLGSGFGRPPMRAPPSQPGGAAPAPAPAPVSSHLLRPQAPGLRPPSGGQQQQQAPPLSAQVRQASLSSDGGAAPLDSMHGLASSLPPSATQVPPSAVRPAYPQVPPAPFGSHSAPGTRPPPRGSSSSFQPPQQAPPYASAAAPPPADMPPPAPGSGLQRPGMPPPGRPPTSAPGPPAFGRPPPQFGQRQQQQAGGPLTRSAGSAHPAMPSFPSSSAGLPPPSPTSPGTAVGPGASLNLHKRSLHEHQGAGTAMCTYRRKVCLY